MSMKQLAAVCALACGSLAVTCAQAYDVDLFMSGSSAVQRDLAAAIPAMMVPGYTVACDKSYVSTICADFLSVKGTFKSVGFVPASLHGRTVRITYRTMGGSLWGVDPVAKAAKIRWMDMDSTGACMAAPADTFVLDSTLTVNQLCNPTGNDDGSANSYGEARIPDLGVSDVEPKLFEGINLEYDRAAHTYKNALPAVDLAGIDSFPVLQQAYGIAMSNVIPHDMTTSNPALNMFVDKGTLLGLLSAGTLKMHDWSGVANAPLAAINPLNASNGSNKPVVVCRQVQGSGTQATANYFVNNFGCSGAAYSTPSRMADSAGFDATGIYVANTVTSSYANPVNPIIIDPSYGYTVIENPTSGNVRSCLAAAQNGTNWSFSGDDGNYYQVTFSGAATGTTTPYTNGDPLIGKPFGAVGVLSYDSANKENGWHFHDLNGLLTANAAAIDASNRPSTSTAKYATAAMIKGVWDFFSEVSMQYRNGGNGKPALVDATPGFITNSASLSTGPVYTLANALVFNILGAPTLTSYNSHLGIAALPTYFVPDPLVTINNVAKGTKGGNTCTPKIPQYKAQFWN